MRLSIRRPARIAIALGLAIAGPTATSARADDEPDVTLGHGTALAYENCYEHVGGFRVPLSLFAVELPDGFRYQTFDAGGTIGQLTVVGLDCELHGVRVLDVFVNASVIPPPGFTASLLRVRSYTSQPLSATRFAQWCFGDAVLLGEVEAAVTITPSGRSGRVHGTDGTGSIELVTTTPGDERKIDPATIRHFSVKHGRLYGLLEFTADGALRDRGSGTLILDGGEPIQGLIGQHVYPAAGDPFTFTYRGLSACPPGLDWND
jgi:hypothetical protein